MRAERVLSRAADLINRSQCPGKPMGRIPAPAPETCCFGAKSAGTGPLAAISPRGEAFSRDQDPQQIRVIELASTYIDVGIRRLTFAQRRSRLLSLLWLSHDGTPKVLFKLNKSNEFGPEQWREGCADLLNSLQQFRRFERHP